MGQAKKGRLIHQAVAEERKKIALHPGACARGPNLPPHLTEYADGQESGIVGESGGPAGIARRLQRGGSPAYVQWLISPQNQHLLHGHQPKRYPTLVSDEVLLEGAYMFI